MEDVLINITPQETRVAVLLAGVVQELHIERSASRGLVGNIYLGKVARVLPGMQSAFIDIGLERAAFLHVADIWESRHGNGNGSAGNASHAGGAAGAGGLASADAGAGAGAGADAGAGAGAGGPSSAGGAGSVHGGHGGNPAERPTPIERLVREGDPLLVQVVKDPIGTKGARLSTQISLAGRMLVYLPQDPHIGVSQRIENEAERAHLRETLTRLMPPGETGGFIVRTSAEDAAEDELRADAEYLRKRWTQIRDASRQVPAPSLLYQELSLAQRVLRDVVTEQTAAVQIDSRENFVALQAFATQYVPKVVARVLHYSGERPMFDLYQIDDEIQKALSRRVDLKSGGYLIIDQTEAMTTIDVNTGAFVGTRNFDETIYKTNLEAAHAIARQLRLRNLGGIIVVDFIDMVQSQHREVVLTEYRKALARDRTRVTISGFTQLGLVEMTRKRTRESLAHVLCEPCPTCGGRGQVKTARTVCYEILRDILREARQFADAREFRILAAQPVIDLFLDEESQSLAMLSDFIGKPVSMQVESVYNQEQYDVVLM